MSEFILNAFQEKTVKHVCEYLQNPEHSVYLLADETGIGKTVIASEVAKRITEANQVVHGEQEQRVLYIASSLELANENIHKLSFDGAGVIQGRLSMLWESFEDPKKRAKIPQTDTKLFALTPTVSLTMDGRGTEAERKRCFDRFWELQASGKTLGNQELIAKIKEIDGLIGTLQKRDKQASRNHQKYVDLLRENRHKSTQLLTRISEKFAQAKKYEEIQYAHNLNEDAQAIAQQVIAIYLVENVQRYMLYTGQSKELDDMLKLKSITSIVKELVTGTNVMQKYCDILWGQSKEEVTDNLFENPKEFVNNLATKIGEKWGIIWNEICNNKKLCDLLLTTLEEVYFADYYQLLRRYMAYYSLVEYVKPNVVIIDEIQNYPFIFSEGLAADENSAVIKQILDEVLGRTTSLETTSDVKVLMLSATPYAYKNAIEIEDDDTEEDEPDTFTKHLVGLEDILSYMQRQNHCDVDVVHTWKSVQDSLLALKKNSLLIQKIDEGAYEFAQKLIEQLEKEMFLLGISRSERPKKTYKPEDGKFVVNQLDIAELANYFVKGKKVCGTRLSLSLPRDVSADKVRGCGYKIYEGAVEKVEMEVGEVGVGEEAVRSSRVDALLADLFEKKAFLYLFVPPNKPTKILEGVYKGRVRSYGKTLLFSAYNAVPQFLQETTEKGLCDRVIAYSIEQGLWKDEATFLEAYEKVCAKSVTFAAYRTTTGTEQDGNPDHIRNLPVSDEAKALLYDMFTTRYARRILLGIYGQRAIEEYDVCVDAYCSDGNFSAVIQEFAYMCSLQKGVQTIEKCLLNADFKEPKAFSVAYCSSLSADFEEKIRSFNNPFYPFAFFITSMAEEGHDFHWYSDRIVHWNVPTSPISLIQREGRIDRADCMSVRKAIADAMKEESCASWEEMVFRFREKNAETLHNDLYQSMFPKFITSDKENKIYRSCYYYPLSSEYFRWSILMKNLEYYRSMFGACDSVHLEELGDVLQDATVWLRLKELQLDLHVV